MSSGQVTDGRRQLVDAARLDDAGITASRFRDTESVPLLLLPLTAALALAA